MKALPHTFLAILLAGLAYAQQPMMGPPGGPPPPGGRGLGGSFFPVELVMRNQQAIGLTAEQRETIRDATQKASPQFNELQWQLSAEEEALQTLIKEQSSDSEKVLTQFNKVLQTENEMKRLQFSLMLAIKNVLTAEQQAKLSDIKQRERPHRGPPHPPLEGPPPAD
jgi:Spy/CpxP family protein refolding chaperone